MLFKRSATQQGRARAEAAQGAQPIETLADVAKLVTAAERVGGKPYLVTLLCLDGGLRISEATALEWSDVHWNRSVEENGDRGAGLPSGAESGVSGRELASCC